METSRSNLLSMRIAAAAALRAPPSSQPSSERSLLRPLHHHRRAHLAAHFPSLVILVLVLGCSEQAQPHADTTSPFSKVLELRGERISELTARPISELGNPRWKNDNPIESGVFLLKVVWQAELEETYSRISTGYAHASIPLDYTYDVLGTPGTLSDSLLDEFWIAEKSSRGYIAPTAFKEKLPSDEQIIGCKSRQQFVDLLGKPISIAGSRWVLFSIAHHQRLNVLRVGLGDWGLTIYRGTATPSAAQRDLGKRE